MDPNRKAWNDRHKDLRKALTSGRSPQTAIDLFLVQHGMVHSARVSRTGLHSFEDEILEGMSGEQIRRIPQNCHHSVAWVLWHLARIEDVTMNILVADSVQLAREGDWFRKLNIDHHHTGNAMSDAQVVELSDTVDIKALRAYRVAVGRRTRKIVKTLSLDDFAEGVDPGRIQRIRDEGAVLPEAEGIIRYWAGKDIAGLLLMPPTRHSFLHLNEARRLKERKR